MRLRACLNQEKNETNLHILKKNELIYCHRKEIKFKFDIRFLKLKMQ